MNDLELKKELIKRLKGNTNEYIINQTIKDIAQDLMDTDETKLIKWLLKHHKDIKIYSTISYHQLDTLNSCSFYEIIQWSQYDYYYNKLNKLLIHEAD